MERIVHVDIDGLDNARYALGGIRAILDVLMFVDAESLDAETVPALAREGMDFLEDIEGFMRGCEDGG